ncbi:MAG TPA: hypothetical protein VGO87_12455 [Acidimicrobiia bacterium]|jgi:hypothetical protein
MGFYDEVLRELLVAMGGALFVGNLMALLRRRAPAAARAPRSEEDGPALAEAPLARTVTYLVIGFVVAFWGIASLVAG